SLGKGRRWNEERKEQREELFHFLFLPDAASVNVKVSAQMPSPIFCTPAVRLAVMSGVVHGPESIFGSSTTAWYWMVSASTTRHRSVTCSASECGQRPLLVGLGLSRPSASHVSLLSPVTSTTSVSPSQRATESPKYVGMMSGECFSPSPYGMMRNEW